MKQLDRKKRPRRAVSSYAPMPNMEQATFKSWLEAYGRAWEGRDPQAATALYAEDATYQVTPFVAPFCRSPLWPSGHP